MPATPTPRLKLPLPAEADPADVPADLLKLANALDAGTGGIGAGVAVDGQGTFSSRPVAATPGRYFYATDAQTLYRDTGTAWVPVGGLPIVTALPAAPYDGQEVLLRSTAAVGVGVAQPLWHMRYDAAVTDTWKWKYVGGAPHNVAQSASGSITTANPNTYAAMPNGPSYTPPQQGVYLVRFSGGAQQSVAGLNELRVAVALAGVATGDQIVDVVSSAAFVASTPNVEAVVSMNAPQAISLVAATNNTAFSLGNPSYWRMLITPVRLG